MILDIQMVLNNRPLSYCDDDLQLPILTPNMLLFGKANYLLELSPADVEEGNLQKRAKYLKNCIKMHCGNNGDQNT